MVVHYGGAFGDTFGDHEKKTSVNLLMSSNIITKPMQKTIADALEEEDYLLAAKLRDGNL